MTAFLSHARARPGPMEGRAPVRRAAGAVAVLLVLVGGLGFLPGVTVGELRFAGPGSQAELFGAFRVSVLQNLVHLAVGLAGLVLARTVGGARAYLLGGGLLLLLLWLYGLLVDQASRADVLAVDAADGWLHLALGVGMVAAAGLPARIRRRPRARRAG